MQTLYDALTQHHNWTRYDETFATAILAQDGRFQALTLIDVPTGEFKTIRAKALLIASGGIGTLYGFTIYSQTVTGDGQALAYRAGLALEDPEFLQFHPTGLVPSGILMTEGCRGEGGYLRNRNGDRFMENYAKSMMELAPRDIVSRAEMTEILEGRGIPTVSGLEAINLDMTHLGADKINHRLPLIREVTMKFLGIDPITDPVPIRPVAHYSMGGIEADINGKTAFDNVWVAGEVACTSLHGANRLGTNSTAECLVWGGIAGSEVVKFLAEKKPSQPPEPTDRIQQEERRVFTEMLGKNGPENPYTIRTELRRCMDDHLGVYRSGTGMSEGLEKIRRLKERFQHIGIVDKNRVYNSNLINALETEYMLTLAETMTMAALAREESRGGHARTDFPKRDDEQWLKHSLVRWSDGEHRLDYKPVTITHWKPVERKY